MSKIKLLKEWNLVDIKRTRSSRGKWLNNTYMLLDKSVWKKPPTQKLEEKKRCLICGTLTVDVCHVTPKREGGTLKKSNTIYLCPTHHRFFVQNLSF